MATQELTGSVTGSSSATGSLAIHHSLSAPIPWMSGYDFAADPNCVSLYNAETWATYLKDQSGEGQDLQCTPQVNITDFKEGDGCLEVDASTRPSGIDYADADLGAAWPGKSGTLNKTISVSLWFKTHVSVAIARTLLKKNGLSAGWGLFLDPTTIRWFIGNSLLTDWKAATGTFQTNTWYHVGATFDNSDKSYRIRVYDSSIAGNWADKTGNFTDNMTVSTQDVSFAYGITRSASSMGYNFDGLIDDAAVFDDVLTAGEIDDCRTGAHDYGADANCVAHWSFDSANFLTEDKGNLAVHEISVPTLDTTVFRMGNASMSFFNDNDKPAYRNDTDLSANYPYKSGTTNLEWSTCFWFRVRAQVVGRVGLVCKFLNNATGSVSVEWTNPGTLELHVRYAGGSSEHYDHTTTINTLTWYHVVVAVSAAAKTYLIDVWDDTAKTAVQVSGVLLHDPLVSDYPWVFGGVKLDTSTGALDGWMDEIAMFNVALTQVTITEIRLEAQSFAVSTITGTLALTHSLSASVDALSTVTAGSAGLATVSAAVFQESILQLPPPVPVPWKFANDALLWGEQMSRYTEEQLIEIFENLSSMQKSVGGVLGSTLTASRLVATTTGGTLVSVDLANWIAGTGSEISVADDGDGSVTIGIVDPLILGKGGTGTALSDPGADRILFWDETDNLLKWLSVGNSVAITGTTLDAIQDIRASASPAFAGLSITSMKSGATQAGAGAAENESWRTSGHATLPDNIVMIGE